MYYLAQREDEMNEVERFWAGDAGGPTYFIIVARCTILASRKYSYKFSSL
jgi:hypothetical protein